jgi:HlyD family secretion protein
MRSGTILPRKSVPWLLVAVGTVILAIAFALGPRSVLAPHPGVQVSVRRGELRLFAQATGYIVPARAVDISPPYVEGLWEFKVTRLVPEGTNVSVGDVLVEFDGQEVIRRLTEQRAAVSKAQEEVSKCRLEYDVRLRDLRIRAEGARVNMERARHMVDVDASLISMADFRRLQIQYDQARSESAHLDGMLEATLRMSESQVGALTKSLEAAQLRLRQLEVQQRALQVRAPIAGTVIYVKSATGDKKTVGQSAWRGEVILQIPCSSSISMAATLEEADSGAVRAGQEATVRLDAFPEVEIRGRVASVGSIVREKTPDLPVKVVDVQIDLDQQDPRVQPGMSSTALIEVQRRKDVLLIPFKAVREKAGRPFVLVVDPKGGIVERHILLGRREGESIEVLEGLKDGDRVYQ